MKVSGVLNIKEVGRLTCNLHPSSTSKTAFFPSSKVFSLTATWLCFGSFFVSRSLNHPWDTNKPVPSIISAQFFYSFFTNSYKCNYKQYNRHTLSRTGRGYLLNLKLPTAYNCLVFVWVFLFFLQRALRDYGQVDQQDQDNGEVVKPAAEHLHPHSVWHHNGSLCHGQSASALDLMIRLNQIWKYYFSVGGA